MNQELITVQTVDALFQETKFKFLTKEILLAALSQESNLNPYFSRTDKQYISNMRVATRTTGFTEKQILEFVILPNGKIAKFRLEPGYYVRNPPGATPRNRFFYSISTGVGQCMSMNLLPAKSPIGAYEKVVKEFMGDLPAQVKKAATMLESLMRAAYNEPRIKVKSLKTLAAYAFRGYNGGSILTTNKDAIRYSNEVLKKLYG